MKEVLFGGTICAKATTSLAGFFAMTYRQPRKDTSPSSAQQGHQKERCFEDSIIGQT